MSSTLIPLTQGVWTQITTTSKYGFIRHHQGNTKIVYVTAPSIVAGLDPSTAVMRDTIMGSQIIYEGVDKDDFVWAYAISSDAKIVVSDDNGEMLNLDADYFNGLAGIISQSYTEANSKLGTQHEGSILITDLAGETSHDTIFISGSLPVSLKGRSIGYSGEGVIASIYRSPVYTGGISQDYQNASDINPVTGLSQILTGAAVTNAGTLVFAPDNLIGNTSPLGKGSTPTILGREKLLRPNTTYLFRITSIDTLPQNVSSLLSWYEGVLDLPRS